MQSKISATTACYASLSNIDMENQVREYDILPEFVNSPTVECDVLPETVYSTTLAINCNQKSNTINENVILAHLRPSSAADKQLF